MRPRQHDVEDDDVERVLGRLPEAVDPVGRVHDHETLGPQAHGEGGREPCLVFDVDLHRFILRPWSRSCQLRRGPTYTVAVVGCEHAEIVVSRISPAVSGRADCLGDELAAEFVVVVAIVGQAPRPQPRRSYQTVKPSRGRRTGSARSRRPKRGTSGSRRRWWSKSRDRDPTR